MNIVEIITKLLGSGDTLSKIAALLGIGEDQAGKAVGAAVPSLLAGLIGATSKPEGASQLAGLLSQQAPNALDDVGSVLTSGASAGLGDGNPLSSLLGSAGLGQLSRVISKFTGVNEATVGKLMGMLAPMVLGVLGKQAKGLDAGGLTSLLSGQASHISSALPSGLGNMLSSAVPSLGSVLGNAGAAASSAVQAGTAAAAGAARQAEAAAAGAARQAEAAASPLKKLLIPLILAVLAFFLVQKMCRKAPEVANQATAAAGQAAAAAGAAVDGMADQLKFTGDVTGLIKDATTAVGTIKDEAGATAALPKLKDISTKLAGLKPMWSKLPAPAQKAVADSLRPLIEKLREAVKPVLALPVVGASLKPVVDEVLTALDGFAPAA